MHTYIYIYIYTILCFSNTNRLSATELYRRAATAHLHIIFSYNN